MSRTITAIIAITILELFALWQKLDGTYLEVSIAAIAGLAGYYQATKGKTK